MEDPFRLLNLHIAPFVWWLTELRLNGRPRKFSPQFLKNLATVNEKSYMALRGIGGIRLAGV